MPGVDCGQDGCSCLLSCPPWRPSPGNQSAGKQSWSQGSSWILPAPPRGFKDEDGLAPLRALRLPSGSESGAGTLQDCSGPRLLQHEGAGASPGGSPCGEGAALVGHQFQDAPSSFVPGILKSKRNDPLLAFLFLICGSIWRVCLRGKGC